MLQADQRSRIRNRWRILPMMRCNIRNIDWRVTRRRHRPAASRPAGLGVGRRRSSIAWLEVVRCRADVGRGDGAAIKAKGDEIRDKKAK